MSVVALRPAAAEPNRILLGQGGKAEAPEPVRVDIPALIAGRLVIQGNSGAGKSWLLRRLLEQSHARVQQLVIDPEGEFSSLADKFEYACFTGADLLRVGGAVFARHLREGLYSAVVDLSDTLAEDRALLLADICGGLIDTPAELWRPLVVAVDEAHLLVPLYDSGEVSAELRKRAVSALADLMTRGRKRGVAGIIVTTLIAETAKPVISKATNYLVGRTVFDRDLERAAGFLGLTVGKASALRRLADGEFVGIGPALGPRLVRFKAGPVATEARRVAISFEPPPIVGAEDAKASLAALPSAPIGIQAEDDRGPGPRRKSRAKPDARWNGWASDEISLLRTSVAHGDSNLETTEVLRRAGFERSVSAVQAQKHKLGITADPKIWTEAEKDIVRAGYAAKRTRDRIAIELYEAGFERTKSAIGWIAGELGLNQAPKEWTEDEYARLRELAARPGIRIAEIAEALDRPYGGVTMAMQQIGLRLTKPWTAEDRQKLIDAPGRGLSISQIAEELGRKYAAVAKIAEKMGVVFGKGPRPKVADRAAWQNPEAAGAEATGETRGNLPKRAVRISPEQLVEYLRSSSHKLVPTRSGHWLMDEQYSYTLPQLLERANKLRGFKRSPPFVLAEEAE